MREQIGNGCLVLLVLGVWAGWSLLAFTIGCAHPDWHPLWWFN